MQIHLPTSRVIGISFLICLISGGVVFGRLNKQRPEIAQSPETQKQTIKTFVGKNGVTYVAGHIIPQFNVTMLTHDEAVKLVESYGLQVDEEDLPSIPKGKWDAYLKVLVPEGEERIWAAKLREDPRIPLVIMSEVSRINE